MFENELAELKRLAVGLHQQAAPDADDVAQGFELIAKMIEGMSGGFDLDAAVDLTRETLIKNNAEKEEPKDGQETQGS